MAMRFIVIGGGISGLSLAYFLKKTQSDLELILIESSKRTGGKVWTDKDSGFIVESGVNAFMNNKPKTLELASMISINPLKSDDSARKRFIFSDGSLKRLPESPPAFFKSNLLSVPGRLRLILEPFIAKGNFDDETLAEFAIRRLGVEAYEKLIDPMASGIYAGDPEVMSLKSCFPRINEVEQTYGSLIKGLLKLQLKAKKEGKAKVGPGPGGVLTSFANGMQEMTDTISSLLGGAVRLSSRAVSVDKSKNGYIVHLSDGSKVETDGLAIATPAYETSKMLKDFDKNMSESLDGIKYPPLAIVSLGYKKNRLDVPLDAFGFLVPKREGRKILGTLYDSSIFPNRAPEGYALLRIMMGGAKAPDVAMKDEAWILRTAIGEIRDIVGIKVDPDFHRVFKHEHAIPQYEVGHSNRIAKIDAILLKHRGLYIGGNALRGISFNDCIENAFKISEKIKEEIL